MFFETLKAALLIPSLAGAKRYCLDLIPSLMVRQCLQVDWPVQLEKSIEVQFSVYCDIFGSASDPITFDQTSPRVFEVSDESRGEFNDYVQDIQGICAGIMRIRDGDLSEVVEIDNELILKWGGARRLKPCSRY
ncbi:hypothetical protein FOL47_000772 [Perkinsus chesapeaki]|uniref:Uncharacterized protein n=1 Tax=Perkinsus chesapeaki TaxID=330153 RepID=A0A7J6KV12_PERCH|nr:hypothetical protein FOL47_000772 [Perkinsus chesapeaki]